MPEMNNVIAENIKRLRHEKKISLEKLAKLSGVSKSMLAQIERGEGNPSISTVWKIATGMMVPFDALTIYQKQGIEIIKFDNLTPTFELGKKIRNFSIFPDDENRRFAVYYVEVDPGASWDANPHLRGTTEFISIFQGELTVELSGKAYCVKEKEAIRFKGDEVHSYANSGKKVTILSMILYNMQAI